MGFDAGTDLSNSASYMTNTSFRSSPSGRLLLATAGFNALGMGLLGLIGPSSIHLPILAIVPLASIILCLFVVGLAVEREDSPVLAMLLALPFAAGLAYAGLSVAPRAGLVIAMLLVVAGAQAVAVASGMLRAGSSVRRYKNEDPTERTDHLRPVHRT
jgi:hypothetical protein